MSNNDLNFEAIASELDAQTPTPPTEEIVEEDNPTNEPEEELEEEDSDSFEDLVDDDEEPEEEESEDKPEDEPVTYKVKVNGEELEVSLDDLVKGYTHGKAAEKKFNEAALMRKQAETFIELLQENPFHVLNEMGVNVRELSEKYLVEILQEEMLPVDEREKKDLQKKLREYEEKERRAKAEREKAEELEMYNKYQSDFNTMIKESLEQAGLPNTKMTRSALAGYMHQVISSPDIDDSIKSTITFNDLVPLVVEDFEREMQEFIGRTPTEKLAKITGEEKLKEVRKWDVERASKKARPKVPEKQAPRKNPSKKKKQRETVDDFFDSLSDLYS